MLDYPFTPVPNWFFQVAPGLKEAELRIMLEVWFQTAGKQRTENVLAYSFIADQTGITSTSSISAALKSLEARELITRKSSKISGQRITVLTTRPPGQPVQVLRQAESQGLRQAESTTPLSGVKDSANRSHNKNPNRIMIQDSTPESKLTDDQQKSLEILVGVGLSESISRRLIALAWSRGRDLSYIEGIVGYAAQFAKRNLPGLVRRLIEQDSDVIQPLEAIQAPTRPKGGITMSKWQHGGIHHFAVEHSCEECHPELIAQREAREATWLLEDGQAVNDA